MSENIENGRKFMNFIISPLEMSSIDKVYKEYGVVCERADVYRDFTLSLNRLIQDSYLGDDVMDETNQKIHFDWCWNKVCEDFSVLNFYFRDNQELCSYFRNFFWKNFYKIPNKKNSEYPKSIEPVYIYLFDYNHVKKPSDVDKFISVYLAFNLSFKND